MRPAKGERERMFTVYSTDDGRNLPIEYLPAGAIVPKRGMALVQSGGNLAVCTGANVPTYISMIEKEAAVDAGEIIPVVRVTPGVIWKTNSSVAMTSIKLGQKVTIDSTGMLVTATTGDNGAEVVYIEDTAAGGCVHVRF